MVWNYLLWHLFDFWCKPALSTRGGSSGLKLQYFPRFFTTKLEFCYLNFSKNIQLFKNLFVSEQSITFRLHKTCVTFSWSPPWQQLVIIIEKGGKRFKTKLKVQHVWSIFFSNWYSDLYQKWQYIGIFHPLRIFWCLKLRGQSIRFCTASYLHGTPMRNLHFCVLFVHRYFFSKWYHCTSFKLDLLFVSYKLYLSRF